jgi:hypothetical protein
MTEYIVVCLNPFNKKRKVTILKQTDLIDAFKIGENHRRSGNDVFILRKEVIKSESSGKDESIYTLENYGYYKVYNFINKIIFLFIVILILGIMYLYFKFFKQ